jgi:uncharacterized membrane protein YeaQ/YmgE (transglycosylase-associated protein family)
LSVPTFVHFFKSMLTQFAIRLICGLSLVWCVMPRAQVTSGFFRIQMLVTLGLSALAGMAAGLFMGNEAAPTLLTVSELQIIAGVLGALSFIGSVFWTLERRTGGERFGFLIAAIALVTLILNCVSRESLSTLAGNLYWLSELATAGVSGAVVGGMLLGHWYLTAPTMSTSPLNRVNVWLGAWAALRLLLAIIATVLFHGAIFAEKGGLRGFSTTDMIWVTGLHYLGGMLGPLACCVMVQRIMKYRNTQSATGVLFVGVILAFLGEMIGALLRNELQLPL